MENYQKLLKNKGLSVFYLADENIILAGSTADILAQVQKTLAEPKKSLAKNTLAYLALRKFGNDYDGRLYLNLPAVNNFSGIKENPYASLISGQIQKAGKQISAGIKLNNDKLVILSAKNITGNTSSPLLTQIPGQTELNFNFFNGQKAFAGFLSSLAPDQAEIFNQNLKYLENQLAFDFNKDVLPLFPRQGQFMILPNGKYLLSADFAGQPSAKISKIDDLLKQYLAYLNPSEKIKTMPDKSQITMIIKNPSQISLVKEAVNNKEIKEFTLNGSEFGYILSDDKLILANSIENLRQIANGVNLTELSKLDPCQNLKIADLTIKTNLISQNFPFWNYFDYANAIIPANSANFWLCLD